MSDAPPIATTTATVNTCGTCAVESWEEMNEWVVYGSAGIVED